MSDGYLGFVCGLLVGLILGVLILSIIIVMNEERNKHG